MFVYLKRMWSQTKLHSQKHQFKVVLFSLGGGQHIEASNLNNGEIPLNTILLTIEQGIIKSFWRLKQCPITPDVMTF